jgi:hypothetical protein
MKGNTDLAELFKGELVAESLANSIQDGTQYRVLIIDYESGEHDSDNAIILVPSNEICVPASHKQGSHNAFERSLRFFRVLVIRDFQQHQNKGRLRALSAFPLDSNHTLKGLFVECPLFDRGNGFANRFNEIRGPFLSYGHDCLLSCFCSYANRFRESTDAKTRGARAPVLAIDCDLLFLESWLQ